MSSYIYFIKMFFFKTVSGTLMASWHKDQNFQDPASTKTQFVRVQAQLRPKLTGFILLDPIYQDPN